MGRAVQKARCRERFTLLGSQYRTPQAAIGPGLGNPSVRGGGGEALLAEEGAGSCGFSRTQQGDAALRGKHAAPPRGGALPSHTPVSQGWLAAPQGGCHRCSQVLLPWPGLASSMKGTFPGSALCPSCRGFPGLPTGDVTTRLEGRVFLSEFPARYTEESNVGLAYGLAFKLRVPKRNTLGNGNREQGLTFYFREQLQRLFHKKSFREFFFFWLKKDEERQSHNF